MPLGQKLTPSQVSHVLHRLILGKTWKNLLVWNHKAKSFDIWYVAWRSRPLPSLFKLCHLGPKLSLPQVLPGTWPAFNRYLYVSFKQNSGEQFSATWSSSLGLKTKGQNLTTFCICFDIMVMPWLMSVFVSAQYLDNKWMEFDHFWHAKFQ